MNSPASTKCRSATEAIGRNIVPLCACIVFLLSGCDRISQISRYLYLRQCDTDIKKAAQAIESAQNDPQRASAYVDRGAALGEKARYSRAFKLIPGDEYARLFDLAIKDHGQAVALQPDNAEMYYRRGRTYYFRAAMDLTDDPKSRAFFAPAKADFSKAIELDSRHFMAFDMRGLINEQAGEWDQAIADYAQEMALNPQGRFRLADAYCGRGSSYLKEKKVELAVSDFEKSIEIGSSADGCACDPYNPLVGIYLDQTREYDNAREVVRRAKTSRRWIAPEFLEKLKKATPR